MGLPEKIAELEAEYAKTQKNKATEVHLGILKAKIAKLKQQIEASSKKSGGPKKGFDVKKSGDASVVLIGLPSVGKSTLLGALTGAKSKVGAYAFTTLTCIPGVLTYKGAKIQVLDLPGIITGAKKGVGRGKEILAVARNADLVLLILDVFQPNYRQRLIEELYGIGIRLDQKPADINIHELERGGLDISYAKKHSHLNDRLITAVLKEYGIFNASVNIREDATVDQLIDTVVGTRKYVPSLTVLNKVDLVKKDFLKSINYVFLPVAADKCRGVGDVKSAVFKKLNLIRVYTKSQKGNDDEEPLLLKNGTTAIQACEKIHRSLKEEFKAARVWGPSAKYPGQRVSTNHKLKDGDTLKIEKR